MIISESRNFVYVHIPKTGGTSMHAMLAPALDLDHDLDVLSKKLSNGNRGAAGIDPATPLVKHSGVRRLQKILGRQKFDSMFSFAVVRNPFARAYSAFTFVQKRATEHPDPDIRAFSAPFLDLSFDDIAADMQGYAKQIASLRPQTAWVPKPQHLSFIARLETLEADWLYLRDVLGLEACTDAAPKRENVTRATPEWASMSATAAAHLADYYAEDFKLFGYAPTLPALQSEVA